MDRAFCTFDDVGDHEICSDTADLTDINTLKCGILTVREDDELLEMTRPVCIPEDFCDRKATLTEEHYSAAISITCSGEDGSDGPGSSEGARLFLEIGGGLVLLALGVFLGIMYKKRQDKKYQTFEPLK
mmetsp:Transcript_11558/g.17440  ORF Transcript_11558/g.17440 Transcript_11558/m.17440 type:complete len:129 (-) Transcript_11558:38-424(-)